MRLPSATTPFYGAICSRFCSERATVCGPVAFNSLRRERGVDVWENSEDLVETGDIENVLYAFLHARDRELAAVFLDVLHAFNQDGQAGAVEVSHLGKIDNHPVGPLCRHRAKRFRYLRRDVQVDLALEGQNV